MFKSRMENEALLKGMVVRNAALESLGMKVDEGEEIKEADLHEVINVPTVAEPYPERPEPERSPSPELPVPLLPLSERACCIPVCRIQVAEDIEHVRRLRVTMHAHSFRVRKAASARRSMAIYKKSLGI